MGHVTYRHHIKAPIDLVFDHCLRADRLPESNTFFTEVHGITGPLARVGDHFSTTMKILGRPITGEVKVTALDRPRLLTLVGTGEGGSSMTWTRRLTSAAGGTDLDIELDYELPGKILTAFADKLFVERSVERGVRHSSEDFAALVEAEALQPV